MLGGMLWEGAGFRGLPARGLGVAAKVGRSPAHAPHSGAVSELWKSNVRSMVYYASALVWPGEVYKQDIESSGFERLVRACSFSLGNDWFFPA